MSDQSDRKPAEFNNVLMDFNSPWSAIVNSTEASNMFIAGLGIVFNHYIAIPNVVGENLLGDIRRTFGEESKNQFGFDQQFDFIENGYLYKYAGQVWGIFQGNNKSFKELTAGLYSSSGAMITFNRYYRGTDKYVGFAEFDKLIPCISGKQFYSVNFQKLHSSMTGLTRLQFPACQIDFVIDSDGNIYEEVKHYVLEHGNIKWVSGGPGVNFTTGKSKLISVRYRYKPTFYVNYMGHDIRISPTFDEMGNVDLSSTLSTDESGNITYKPGPVSANVVADIVFLDRRSAEPVEDVQINTEEDGENVGPR